MKERFQADAKRRMSPDAKVDERYWKTVVQLMIEWRFTDKVPTGSVRQLLHFDRQKYAINPIPFQKLCIAVSTFPKMIQRRLSRK